MITLSFMILNPNVFQANYEEFRKINTHDWLCVKGNSLSDLTLQISDSLKGLTEVFAHYVNANPKDLEYDDVPTGPVEFNQQWIFPVTVSNEIEQDWRVALDWGDHPEDILHFFKLSEGGVFAWEIIPDILLNIEYELDNWRRGRQPIEAHTLARQNALAHISLTSLSSLDQLEERCLTHQDLGLTENTSHILWPELHLKLAKAGVLDPEDSGEKVLKWRSLGYVHLIRYREAALALYAYASQIPGVFFPDLEHPLAATVSLEYFLRGPWDAAWGCVVDYLEFCVSTFLTNPPSEKSSYIVCFGHRSTHFSYAPGLVGMSQIYKGNCHVPSLTSAGQRLDVMAAMLSKSGFSALGQVLAAYALLETEREASYFQPWIELGMSLHYQNKFHEAQACFRQAQKYEQSRWLNQQILEGYDPEQLSELWQNALKNNDFHALMLAYIAQGIRKTRLQTLPSKEIWRLLSLPLLIQQDCLSPLYLGLLNHIKGFGQREIVRHLPNAQRALYFSTISREKEDYFKAHIHDVD